MKADASVRPAPTRPRPLPAALERLRAQPRWVLWKWEVAKGKWTKVPYKAASPAFKASTTDPETWSDYDTALAVFEAGRADGVGFALLDSEIAAFDLDDCRDPSSGVIEAWAWSLIEEAQSYAEVSVSGTGVRIIGLADGPYVHRNQVVTGAGHIETYRKASRYIVVTGNALEGYGALLNIDDLIDRTVAGLDDAKRQETKAKRKAATDAARPKRETDISRYFNDPGMPRRDGLPDELDDLIRFGVPLGQRSEKFFHVVGWLKDRGHSPGEIESLLAAHPAGIASKFAGRLRAEIDRAFDKAETRSRSTGSSSSGAGSDQSDEFDGKGDKPAGPQLVWYGDEEPEPPPWLIEGVLLDLQTAIIAGQFSAGKTYLAVDLSFSTMTGLPFAGQEVCRTGGVLWLAAEGKSSVLFRLKAAAMHRTGTAKIGELPFARQAFDVPTLTDNDALPKLLALADEAKAGFRDRFAGVQLALIVIDTMGSAAGFDDGNSSSEAQKVMRMLRRVSDATGALVLLIDHFGKIVETGVMGASAKPQSADSILSTVSTRDMQGNHSDRKMSVYKLREGGGSGATFPFKLVSVDLPGFEAKGCAVAWSEPEQKVEAEPKTGWTKALRIFKGALERALIDQGVQKQPFGHEGAKLKAVTVKAVRAEFVKSYPAETSEAKGKAFKRALKDTVERGLVGSREMGDGLDWVWLIKDTATPDIQADTDSTL